MLTYPNDGHNITGAESSVDAYINLSMWFDKHFTAKLAVV